MGGPPPQAGGGTLRLVQTPVWPRPLRPGGTIGICSPAGPSPEANATRATAALQARGYDVRLTPGALARHPDCNYLAGTDDLRAAELNGLLADPSVDMVLCARGGYGCARILDRIDYDAIRRDPKPIVGYSDITALTLGVFARTGVVGFSGIMATAGDGFGNDLLDPFSEASLWAAVTGARPMALAPPEGAPVVVHRGGASPTVAGPVFPACLTLIETLMGTPFLPDFTGAILVIEDVHEELYAIDRALTQLRLAGVLDRLAALVLGSFNGVAEKQAELDAGVPRLALELAPAHVSIVAGLAYGHIPRRLTLPVGAAGTLDLAAGAFTFA